MKLYTTAQACAVLGCGRTTLWTLARRHRIRRVKNGRQIMWVADDVDRAQARTMRQLR